jgi:uncharacterized repeat protein (TIGR01451 family)
VNRIPLLLLIICIFFQKYIAAQSLSWAGNFAGSGFKNVTSSNLDGVGNLYTSGDFDGTVDFDPGPGVLNFTAPVNNADIFITKQSPNGDLLWARQIGGSLVDGSRGIVVLQNYIELSGRFDGIVDFDPGPGVFNLNAGTIYDMFILRLDLNGNFVSVRQIVANSGSVVAVGAIAKDNAGNLVITGIFSGTIDFDPGPGVTTLNAVSSVAFICKFAPSGNFLWVRSVVAGAIFPYEVVTDPENNIVYGGYFAGTCDFDPGTGSFTLTSGGGNDAFVSKLDASGNFVWARHFSNAGTCETKSIAINSASEVFVGGFFSGITDFDPGPAVHNVAVVDLYDAYVVKLSKDGIFSWVSAFGGMETQETTAIDTGPDGRPVLTIKFNRATDFDPGPGTVTLTPTGTLLDIAFLKLTDSGGLDWVKQIGGPNNDAAVSLHVDNDENIYMTGSFRDAVDFDPGPGTTILVEPNVYGVFIVKFGKSNFITGIAFQDNNGNGVYNTGEPLLSNVVLKAVRGSLNYYAITDTNGYYSIDVDTNSYTITATAPLHYNNSVPLSHTADFGSFYGRVDTANHFAFSPLAMLKDLSVYITNLGPARAGRQTFYRISYVNRGTETMNASIQLNHDGLLTFNTSNPLPNTYNAPVAVWNFNNLLPSRTGNIDIAATVSTSVVSGTILKSYVTINPVPGDANPPDNIDSVYHVVLAPLDPNDKKVLPDGAISTGFVAAGNYLNYTIRFQNVGNDTAFLVVIRDTLSTNADINSFQVVSASYPYTVDMHENGIVEWRFENMLLPDSNVSEPRSHGFVRYRIKPKSNLVAGNEIRNKAAIYFDYNAPVITNETVNIVTIVTGVNPGPEIIDAKVFPNPSGSELYIQTKGDFSYRVFNVSGQSVLNKENNRDEAGINVANLQKGVYFILITNRKGKAVQKIIVQ